MKPGIYLRNEAGGVFIHIKCDFEDRERCKSVLGAWWSKKTKTWRYPGFAVFDVIREFPELPCSPGVLEWRKKLHNIVTWNKEVKRGNHPCEAPPPEWLYMHQQVAYHLLMCNPDFALFMDMGTGKTVAVLTALDALGDRTLVVTRSALIYSAWLEDIEERFPWLLGSTIPWQGSKRKRKYEKQIRRGTNVRIILTNFDTYRNDWDFLRSCGCKILVVDESSILKDPKKKTATDKLRTPERLIRHARQPEVERRIIMSGCPAPNSPLEYYQQVQFLDPSVMGDSYYRFRLQWCHQTDRLGYKYDMTTEKKNKMLDRISAISYVISKDECLDLPERTFTPVKMDMHEAQAKAYRQMLRDLIMQHEAGEIEAGRVVTQIMKLRQITSGFAYYREEEDIDDRKTAWIGSPKYKELENLLSDIGDEQAIIWRHFDEEGKRLAELLGDKAVDYSPLKDGEKPQALKDFKKGKYQYLIAHPASLGHGVTLVNCRYAIYFSLSNSYEQYIQSIDRIYRAGQKHNTQIFFLMCNKTIDEEIYYESLSGKQKMSNMGLNYLKKEAK